MRRELNCQKQTSCLLQAPICRTHRHSKFEQSRELPGDRLPGFVYR